MDGFLLIDKPVGWTSFDVVNKIRYIVEAKLPKRTGKKHFPVGHAGTLDPLASGLMIILLGSYTKQANQFSKLDKSYEFTAHLGLVSTTGDEEGDKTFVSDARPTAKELQAVVNKFTGLQSQVPPAYSAIKVAGQKMYKLARRGIEVKLEPRQITIYHLRITGYSYPYINLEARVSSGTYVRSLVEDIGKSLGVGAYTSNIKRTSIGEYELIYASSMENLSLEQSLHKTVTSDKMHRRS